MTAPVILNEFSDEHPFSTVELNVVLKALAGAINALASVQVIQFNPAGGAINTEWVPSSGGDFTGTISAPAVVVGPAGATKYPVVTQNSMASEGTPGAVKKAAAVPDLTQTISTTPTKAEAEAIQAKLNALLAALRAAGMVA